MQTRPSLDVPMASGGSTGHSDQHILLWQHGSHSYTWSLVTDQTTIIHWALVVTQATDIDKNPSCKRTVNSDLAFSSSLVQDLSRASSYLPVPFHR